MIPPMIRTMTIFSTCMATTWRVGKKTAERILQFAEAMEKQEEKVLAAPAIPRLPNYVMFDLEGMPPHLDELDRIYLW